MAYLNQNYNQFTFVQHYLQRCSQVQRAADSDPSCDEMVSNKEQSPVIVLDDDEDEEMPRKSNFDSLPFTTNSSTNLQDFVGNRRQNPNGNLPNAAASSDLHITGVSVLREWIDISELDTRKYANMYGSKTKNLGENEERRYRNPVHQKKQNGENCQKMRDLRNSSHSRFSEQNEKGRKRRFDIQNEENRNCTNGEVQRTENLDSARSDKMEEVGDSQKKQNFEEKKNGATREIPENCVMRILEEKKYTSFKTTNEATKPVASQESSQKTEENDMTWADLNVEEDIETDEEKEETKIQKEEPEAQNREKEESEVQKEENEETEAQNEETATVTGKYKCSYCSYRTSWKSNLSKHEVSRHKSSEEIRWFQCAHCPYKGKTREYLRVHLRVNHEPFITWHSCPSCPLKFKLKQILQDHVLAIHTAPEDIEWFECDRCEFKSKFKQGLKHHKINRHLEANEISWFACKECRYRGKTRRGLRLHVANKHTEWAEPWRAWTPDDVAEAELECKMCGFRTRSKMDYQEHFRSSCYWRRRNM